ncbi:MAG: hypothetical protein V1702_05155 [Candidatus Woesearchaeota archaeon]
MESMEKMRKWAKERTLSYGQLRKYFIQKKGIITVIAVLLVLLVILRDYVAEIIVITLLIIIGFCSMLYNRFIKVSLGIEFIMLSTVTAGFLYGPLAAFITGGIALFAAEVFNQSFQHSTVVSFLGIAAVSIAMPFFSPWLSITALGITMTILYNAIIFPGYILLGSQPWRCILFTSTDIAFNAWVFVAIAPKLIGLLHG